MNAERRERGNAGTGERDTANVSLGLLRVPAFRPERAKRAWGFPRSAPSARSARGGSRDPTIPSVVGFRG